MPEQRRILLKNATIVNDLEAFHGDIVIADEEIEEVYRENKAPQGFYDKSIDLSGCFVIPGVIDSHVHFREPGLTAKADIGSESRAAVFGGVTTFFDMPNTLPQTVFHDALNEKFTIAQQKSHVNYSFFFGATNSNVEQLASLDSHLVPGIKLFMGSSTGNMLVDSEDALRILFKTVSMPVMAHCEDTAIIDRNMQQAVSQYGEDPPVALHPLIRSAEACLKSSSLAVKLAKEYGTKLHIAHISTAEELQLLEKETEGVPQVTGEAVIAHLMFDDSCYQTLGTNIKCNPAVKTSADRTALRNALADGTVFTVATDHAPHLPKDKVGGCRKAASGMPMVQFSLPCMLQLVDEGCITLERMVQLMCHNPSRLFGIDKRGYIRKGWKADITVVKRGEPWTVTEDCIQSKCGWSPLLGHEFKWRVLHTFCNGNHIYDNGWFDGNSRGQRVTFRNGR